MALDISIISVQALSNNPDFYQRYILLAHISNPRDRSKLFTHHHLADLFSIQSDTNSTLHITTWQTCSVFNPTPTQLYTSPPGRPVQYSIRHQLNFTHHHLADLFSIQSDTNSTLHITTWQTCSVFNPTPTQLYTSPPGRPVQYSIRHQLNFTHHHLADLFSIQSDTNSTSVGSILPTQQIRAKTIHSYFPCRL